MLKVQGVSIRSIQFAMLKYPDNKKFEKNLTYI